jgi:hypothetical protein
VTKNHQTRNVEHDGEPVQRICSGDLCLAYIIRASLVPGQTTFVTPPEAGLQIGFVVYPAGGEVPRHVHVPVERHLQSTCEALFVKRGRCEVDIYDDDHQLVASRELRAGDWILLVGGGHGFRMLEDTVLTEIKQGPYMGLNEKRRF